MSLDDRNSPEQDDTVATPEGDEEYPAGVPAGPADGLQVPGGNGPLPYDSDRPKS